jgi:carbonic anhydrase
MKTPVVFGIILVLVGALVGYFYAQTQPTIDQSKNGASALILGCIDPRFANSLAWYLSHSQELHADYDLFTLAGASLGVLQDKHHAWGETFMDHIQLAIDLHDIKEIWCFDHLDCGMYKATLNLKEDKTDGIHIEKMKELRELLRGRFPQLGFQGHIIAVDGSIKKVL